MFELQTPPDYYGQFIAPLQRQQALDMQQQQQNAELQQAKLQQAAYFQKIQQAQQYRQDAAEVIQNPSPEGYRALMLKYPEMHEGLKDAWSTASEQEKTRDVSAASQVYSALQNGRSDLALSLLKDRQTAMKNSGGDDKVTDSIIDMIESGDPAKIKQAQGIAGFVLANAVGPDKIGPTLDSLNGGQYTLGPGEARLDREGNVVATSPFLKGENGAIYEKNGTLPTDATPSSAAASGGMQASISHVLGNEGGYNPKDMNGSPTNFGINYKANAAVLQKMGITPANFKNMTKDQAIQVYASKYWPQSGAENLPANLQAPYFDVYIRNPGAAKRFLAQSNEDPQQFMQLADGYFTKLAKTNPAAAKYAKAWANRDAGNTAIASGATPMGATPDASAPAGYHVLIPGEAKDKIPSGYEPDPAHPGRIRPIPGGPQDTSSDNALTQYGIQPNETGPTVLAKLPANIASQVKALAEGRLPMPSSFALAKPYWQNMLQLTSQYDPTFDAASAPARKAAITAFTGNGKAAQTIGSVNRVANHLELLWKESNRLVGPDTGFGPLNTALATTGQAFQPADAKAYDTEVQFIAGELEKIARNSPGTVQGVNEIISNLSRKQSLPTRQAAIRAAVGIISGSVDPLKDQYNSAFTNGSARPNIPWVSPKAQQIYKKIGGVDLSLTNAGADTNNPSDATGGWVTLPSGLKVRRVQ